MCIGITNLQSIIFDILWNVKWVCTLKNQPMTHNHNHRMLHWLLKLLWYARKSKREKKDSEIKFNNADPKGKKK